MEVGEEGNQEERGEGKERERRKKREMTENERLVWFQVFASPGGLCLYCLNSADQTEKEGRGRNSHQSLQVQKVSPSSATLLICSLPTLSQICPTRVWRQDQTDFHAEL